MVGTRSYGKGVFQEEQTLANGGALKLTVGEYFTPEGVNLAESHGIHPDVEGPGRPEDRGRRGRSSAPSASSPARSAADAGPRARTQGRAAERRDRRFHDSRRIGTRSVETTAARAEIGAGDGRGAAARGARLPRLPADDRGGSAGSGEVGRARKRAAPRPHRAGDLHRRPGHRPRLRRRRLRPARGRRRPGLDPHRRRRRPRQARLAARPGGAAARQQHLRPRRGRADAAARALQRGLQPGAGGRAAGGDDRGRAGAGDGAAPGALLPQPHPLRRAPRLRPARRDLRRPGAAAGRGRRTARRRARGRRRPRRAPRRHQPRRRIRRARVRASTPRAT